MDDDIHRYPPISRDEREGLPDASVVAKGFALMPGPDAFDSHEAFFDFMQEVERLQTPIRLRAKTTEVTTVDKDGAKQVGLRLPGGDYLKLADFAREFGVAPATMARILVVRAMRAIPDEE